MGGVTASNEDTETAGADLVCSKTVDEAVVATTTAARRTVTKQEIVRQVIAL